MATNYVTVGATIKTGSNRYPLADINSIKGGLHYVNTVKDLTNINKIHTSKLVDGMLAFVLDTRKLYQWNINTSTNNEGGWKIFNAAGGGINTCTTELLKNPESNPDLFDKELVAPGSLLYNTDTSIYYLAVLNGNTISYTEDITGLNLLYSCSEDSIPATEYIAEKVGNLDTNITRKELEKMTYNDILTHMLFKELMPYITSYASHYPSLTAKSSIGIEVGSDISAGSFLVTNNYITYGYVPNTYDSSTRYWTLGSILVKPGNASLGINSNVATCTAAMTFTTAEKDNNFLYSSWQRQLKTLIDSSLLSNYITLKDLTVIVSADIYGFFYYLTIQRTSKLTEINKAFIEEICTEPNLKTSTLLLNNVEICNKTSNLTPSLLYSYVYIILPSLYKISSAAVLSESNANSWKSVNTANIKNIEVSIKSDATQYKYISKSGELYTITYNPITSNNKYKIWELPKADYNADMSVSPNGEIMRITIL